MKKSYRGYGFSKKMIKEILKLLKEKNVEQYLLEVIQDNKNAFELYKAHDFKISRDFSVFQLKKNSCIPSASIPYKIETVSEISDNMWEIFKTFWDFSPSWQNSINSVKAVKEIFSYVITVSEISDNMWEIFKTFWDFSPSWQNSINSVKAVKEVFSYVIVKDKNNIIGYGIIEKNSGKIPQLAVDKNYRNKNIGKNIINRLTSCTDGDFIKFINIDRKCENIEKFLKSLNFEISSLQYKFLKFLLSNMK